MLKIVLVVIIAIILIAAIGFIAQGTDFIMFRFWAPKYQKVEREIFEKTPSYVKGMIQDVRKAQIEYIAVKAKDAKTADAIAYVIIHRTDGFNLNDPDVPQDIRNFINELKTEVGIK